MAWSDFMKNKMLDAGLEPGDTISLHTADPGKTGAAEVAGGGYARQAVTWGAAAGGAKANSAEVSFTVPAATITHVGIRGAGGFKGGRKLVEPKTFGAGDLCKFPVGELTVDVPDEAEA